MICKRGGFISDWQIDMLFQIVVGGIAPFWGRPSAWSSPERGDWNGDL
jgi:hypothetical protein